MSIFTKRTAFKPFEYPDVTKYKDAINQSFWLVSEFNFISDVQDFHVKLSKVEQTAVKNALLAISQIEVSVKRFWTKIGDRFPKPEIEQVGVTFGESEVRHGDSYSHLLEIMGFNNEFDQLLDNPVIQGRVDYLTKYLKGASDNSDENYALTLTLFSLFIEYVSLFSQFLVIKSFYKHKNVLKDVDNVVDATMKEEVIHALFGACLLDIIKQEFPSWFSEAFYQKIARACQKAYDAEAKIIEWIFEAGDLPFLAADQVKEFTKDRFNQSLKMIGAEPVFEVDAAKLLPLLWFEEDIHGEAETDLFHKKSVGYAKHARSVTAEDLF